MTNYARGARAEYEAKHLLEEAGWLVIRSAGSHGAFDLVAIGGFGARLIQVKRRPATRAELDTLKEAAAGLPASIRVEMWVRTGPSRFSIQNMRPEAHKEV